MGKMNGKKAVNSDGSQRKMVGAKRVRQRAERPRGEGVNALLA